MPTPLNDMLSELYTIAGVGIVLTMIVTTVLILYKLSKDD